MHCAGGGGSAPWVEGLVLGGGGLVPGGGPGPGRGVPGPRGGAWSWGSRGRVPGPRGCILACNGANPPL